MNIVRRGVFFCIFLSLTLLLFSCGCKDHTDYNGDLFCDKCGAESESGALPLIFNGKTTFNIIKGDDLPSAALKKLDDLKNAFTSLGVDLTITYDGEKDEIPCEILIGTVTSRGDDYAQDKHELGPNGFTVKRIGTKIIVLGGSEKAQTAAVEELIVNILGYSNGDESVADAYMTFEDEISYNKDTDISSIRINDTDIKDYTIACDSTIRSHVHYATSLQELLYEKSGYYLKTVELNEAQKSIIIRDSADAGEDGFRIYATSDDCLIIECAYQNSFETALENFKNKFIKTRTGALVFKNTDGTVYTEHVSTVHYEDFGAMGDGVTNDFLAIKAAHEFANYGGQTVYATPGKTYYIGKETGKNSVVQYVSIKTNTVWTDAKFIIDDREISHATSGGAHYQEIFRVLPMESNIYILTEDLKEINKQAITRDTKKLNITFEQDMLLRVINGTHQSYIRYGAHQNNGASQTEIIYVYKDGTISDTTPFLHDFSTVTSIYGTVADLPELLIVGGEFTTRASQENCVVNGEELTVYYKRGIGVERSNTTIRGLKHKVTDEIELLRDGSGKLTQGGVGYNGFFNAGFASHVTFENCTLSGRKYYGICGTYDFGASYTNEVHLINCDMYNFYHENGTTLATNSYKNAQGETYSYWGVGGTNYCKNMIYDGCTLTRYDAHCGVYNGKIINSKLGLINLIGGGDMLIENTTIVSSNRVFALREDYGATWNGTITIRNVTLENTSNVTICSASWRNHYFGYDCYFPNIVIDGLKCKKTPSKINICSSMTGSQYKHAHLETLKDGTTKNKNVWIPPEKITVIDPYGYNYSFPGATAVFFKDTEIVYTKTEQ